jgi:hypothetical protein
VAKNSTDSNGQAVTEKPPGKPGGFLVFALTIRVC